MHDMIEWHGASAYKVMRVRMGEVHGDAVWVTYCCIYMHAPIKSFAILQLLHFYCSMSGRAVAAAAICSGLITCLMTSSSWWFVGFRSRCQCLRFSRYVLAHKHKHTHTLKLHTMMYMMNHFLDIHLHTRHAHSTFSDIHVRTRPDALKKSSSGEIGCPWLTRHT